MSFLYSLTKIDNQRGSAPRPQNLRSLGTVGNPETTPLTELKHFDVSYSKCSKTYSVLNGIMMHTKMC